MSLDSDCNEGLSSFLVIISKKMGERDGVIRIVRHYYIFLNLKYNIKTYSITGILRPLPQPRASKYIYEIVHDQL